MVVERDDRRVAGDLREPGAVDVAQPRQRDEAGLDAFAREQVGRMPAADDHHRAGGDEAARPRPPQHRPPAGHELLDPGRLEAERPAAR